MAILNGITIRSHLRPGRFCAQTVLLCGDIFTERISGQRVTAQKQV